MASRGSGNNHQAPTSPSDHVSPISKLTTPVANPDSIMQDTEGAQPHNHPHPLHLYTPIIPDAGTDHFGTPYASNRAECPPVSLQPKTSSTTHQQASTTNPASSVNASTTRAQLTPSRARLSSSAGRGQPIRTHKTLDPAPASGPAGASGKKSSNRNTQDDHGFTLVQPKPKSRGGHINQANMQVSGLLLSRVGPKAEIAKQPIPFSNMLQALISIDPNIMIFPHNCAVDSIHKASALLKRAQDYKALMDITMTNWGSPSEGKGKLAFSFYIGSTIIGKDLEEVNQSRQFQ